jgi:hypothetical protein
MKMWISNCCGENMNGMDIKVCPKCDEPCELEFMDEEGEELTKEQEDYLLEGYRENDK